MRIEVCAKCGAKNRVDETSANVRQAVCGRCDTELGGSATTDVNAGGAKAGKPEIVTDATFARDVVGAQDNRPVLLDVWAEWCGPCRMIAPALEQLAAESNGRYRVAKLNIDENPQTASLFQVQSIPTLLIFKNGQLVERLVGAQPKQVIAARLAAHT